MSDDGNYEQVGRTDKPFRPYLAAAGRGAAYVKPTVPRVAGKPVERTNDSNPVESHHQQIMTNYKTVACRVTTPHDKKMCQNWHSKLDRRRDPFVHNYTGAECAYQTDLQDCRNGDNCRFAHNMLERMYHPETYKITMCSKALSGAVCERSIFCSFAHSPKDLRLGAAHKRKIQSEAQTPIEKMIAMIRLAGPDGILGSELPKRYLTMYHEAFELIDAEGKPAKIKEILSAQDNIAIEVYKGSHPKFVYDENAKKAVVEAEIDTSKEVIPFALAQERFVEIVKDSGDEGVLGSDLPKKYQAVHGNRIEVMDAHGGKVRIKDILGVHPDIIYKMYRNIQPQYFFVKGGNPGKATEGSVEEDCVPSSWANVATAVPKAANHNRSLPSRDFHPSSSLYEEDLSLGLTGAKMPVNPLMGAPGLSNTNMNWAGASHTTQKDVRDKLAMSEGECADLRSKVDELTEKLSRSRIGGSSASSSAQTTSSAAETLLRTIHDERVQELDHIYRQVGTMELDLQRLPYKEDREAEGMQVDDVKQMLRLNRTLLAHVSKLKGFLRDKFVKVSQAPPAGPPQLTVVAKPANTNSKPKVTPTVLAAEGRRICSMPSCSAEGRFVCTGCNNIFYCGESHQK